MYVCAVQNPGQGAPGKKLITTLFGLYVEFTVGKSKGKAV